MLTLCAVPLRSFQFHKGAIRTTIFDNGMKPQDYFNSIKVRLERFFKQALTLLLLYFNSIKVRLEQGGGSPPQPLVLYFNSIKVRLEPDTLTSDNLGTPVFQFHKGAIRTETKKHHKRNYLYFNSIKVRLEHNITIDINTSIFISIP